MSRYYSNGKLLITGEYVVLNGATSLAVPTKFGQDLTVETINEPQLIWASFTSSGECWFEAVFDLPKLRLTQATFNSEKEGSGEKIAETLRDLLQEAKRMNSKFLSEEKGFIVKTHLSFPRDWGLGSSSTLINNIAQWANVDPFTLLWNAFSGSGYDIACAKTNTPIFYKLEDNAPQIVGSNFNPPFKEHLFFVHLNQKQNSREGIARFKEKRGNISKEIERISEISNEIANTKDLDVFENLLKEHEEIISKIIELPTVKESLFPDYFGEIKSLGAWGGDFVLATGNDTTPDYFKQKGYSTILSYSEMVL